jgi:catechol 2,3-dioxygenase-like lactoylglutathione lyase family enzyme
MREKLFKGTYLLANVNLCFLALKLNYYLYRLWQAQPFAFYGEYMKFRIARHTKNLNRIIDFYGRVLGLQILGEFKDHYNYDGVFLGKPGADWHLEFTASNIDPIHLPDDDDLLVFYAESLEEFNAIKQKFIAARLRPVWPKNPFWESNGITFEDPDGYRIVISLIRMRLGLKK